jgi:hypothetical protein
MRFEPRVYYSRIASKLFEANKLCAWYGATPISRRHGRVHNPG